MEQRVFMGIEPVTREQAEQIQQALESSGVPMTVFYAGGKSITMTHLLALQVMAGVWGNGHARREALEKYGYDYDEVQDYINDHLDDLKKEMKDNG